MCVTHHWPWEPQWHERCRRGWQGHFRWLSPQTERSARRRRTRTQLPESGSTAAKTSEIRNGISASYHCQSVTTQILRRVKGRGFEIFQLTPVPWPADRRAQAGDRPHVPTAQLHLQHATVSQCEISSPAVQPLSRVHDMRHFARKNQNIEERWATSLRNDRGELWISSLFKTNQETPD